jgi:hypothetical protein
MQHMSTIFTLVFSSDANQQTFGLFSESQGFCMKFPRRNIRLIEGKTKCRHLNKLTLKGTLRHVFICLRPKPQIPPYTLYTCIQYTYSHREGGRGES